MFDVFHGTTFVPAPCAAVQPAGSVGGATPSKFSLSSVVKTGVPVCSVTGRLRIPCVVVIASVSWIGVPVTKLFAICRV